MLLLNKKKYSFFKILKKKIEHSISQEIECMGEKNILRDAVEFSLFNGGKRLRPIIPILISKNLNKNFDVTKTALACEFFHTASLIADDLPCMDNEKFRRNKPSLHLKFNESTAILASYSLISSGYELLLKNSKELNKHLSVDQCNLILAKAIEIVSKYAGIHGATFGQFLDLFSKNYSYENICEIIHKKTISLFEISFLLGWMYGGGDLDKLDLVKQASFHFGMAFQIADDLDDLKKEKKINIAISLGKKLSKEYFNNEIIKLKDILKTLGLDKKPFNLITSFLEELA